MDGDEGKKARAGSYGGLKSRECRRKQQHVNREHQTARQTKLELRVHANRESTPTRVQARRSEDMFSHRSHVSCSKWPETRPNSLTISKTGTFVIYRTAEAADGKPWL